MASSRGAGYRYGAEAGERCSAAHPPPQLRGGVKRLHCGAVGS